MQVSEMSSDFDFDHWRSLAADDPSDFERRRAEHIEAFIANVPDHMKQRLRCLQWRIDAERRRSSNPLGACIRVYNMMWASAAQHYELIQTLSRMLNRGEGRAQADAGAKVLPFRQPAEQVSP
jgi:hypothetical protein